MNTAKLIYLPISDTVGSKAKNEARMILWPHYQVCYTTKRLHVRLPLWAVDSISRDNVWYMVVALPMIIHWLPITSCSGTAEKSAGLWGTDDLSNGAKMFEWLVHIGKPAPHIQVIHFLPLSQLNIPPVMETTFYDLVMDGLKVTVLTFESWWPGV